MYRIYNKANYIHKKKAISNPTLGSIIRINYPVMLNLQLHFNPH